MGRSCGQRSEEAEDRIDVAVDVVQIAAVAAAVAVADAEIALPMQVSRQLHARHRRRLRGMCERPVRFGTRGSGRPNGRAARRERVCPYVYISVGAVALQKKQITNNL